MNSSYDIVIIGAGPAGLATGIEAQKSGLSYLIIDKGSIVQGIQRYKRDMFFFSTPELLEIGGVPFIIPSTRPTALDCVNYYRSVAEYYRLPCRLFEKIDSVGRSHDQFLLKTSKGENILSRTVVVATGYYDTPSPLNVPGEDLPHVSHFYNDPLPYYQQDVLIVGGKNSAVEAALDLWRHGARVTLVHRGAQLSSGVKYWILPDFENRVSAGSIKTHFNSGAEKFLPGTTLIRTNGKETNIRTDFAFILIGYRPDVTFLRSLGIQLDRESLAPSHNPETMETNVPNMFVAGGMVGGRFNNKVFIENGREHGKLILSKIQKG